MSCRSLQAKTSFAPAGRLCGGRSLELSLSLLSLLGSLALLALPASAQDKFELKVPAGLPAMRLHPDNPLSEAKIELGKQLYFDPRLSIDNTVSCASCHDPKKGWSNGERFATGVEGQKGGRSAPTIINAGYHYFQFWDGRATHVEGQALGPIQNPIEMNMPLDVLVEKLEKIPGYRKQFDAVFPAAEGGSSITPENIGRAIAAFERTVLSGDAPYDRFKAGDQTALSESAQRGMKLFFGKANCSACHSGPLFTDGAFHNLGVGIDHEQPDLGRHAQTTLEGDRGSFKTPGLREIAHTAPYMHDGSLATLADVVNYYDQGGTPNPQLDEELFALKLNDQEKADLIEFLEKGLSSASYPRIDPPTLPE